MTASDRFCDFAVAALREHAPDTYRRGMGYGLRDEAAGFHHVISRGNNRRRIFRGEDDRTGFLHLLHRAARK